jgi:putative nucleotidyltransferase with HDIG domain
MSPFVDSRTALPPAAQDWLNQQLQRDADLPVLPEAAARVITLCDDDDADARKIEGVLSRDPALTASVLKVANSSLYGAKDPIVSLQQAVSRLGLATVRNLALSASLQGRVFDVRGRESQVAEVWEHCSTAGVFAREIARRLRRNVEAAFLCGLVHDVGRPIVLQALVRMPKDRGVLSEEQIQRALDEHHAPVGAQLVAQWGLGEFTAAAVLHHHDPEQAAPYEDDARLTRLADLLAHWAILPGSSAEDFPADDPAILGLNLYPDDVDEILALRERVLVAAEAFQ